MKTCHEAAQSIWDKQTELNTLMHPLGLSTVTIGNDYRKAKHSTVRGPIDLAAHSLDDYWFALQSEIVELMDNFYWKHWSKEARKEGKRFLLTNPDKTGEGTAQNVAVELTDIVFFLLSLMQCDGEPATTWTSQWGDPEPWETLTWGQRDATTPLNDAAKNHDMLVAAKELQFHALLASRVNVIDTRTDKWEWAIAVKQLRLMCVLAGLGWADMLRLYDQKYEVNVERTRRGRAQVNDAHAHAENLAVT